MRIDKIRKSDRGGLLDGQMLVAMPGMPDPRFAGTVIYVCAHSDEGAMGLVLNRRASTLALPDLLVQLDVIASAQAIRLPERAGRMAVLSGGPVETSRGFVLHSTDFMIKDSTLPISETVGLTITIDILRAIARGEGPDSALLALGYAGWGPGQLEQEMQINTWLHAPPDHDILFGHDFERKYDRALKKLGIDPAFLSQEAGHA